eukprot:3245671-Rhodomonas_salina.1
MLCPNPASRVWFQGRSPESPALSSLRAACRSAPLSRSATRRASTGRRFQASATWSSRPSAST